MFLLTKLWYVLVSSVSTDSGISAGLGSGSIINKQIYSITLNPSINNKLLNTNNTSFYQYIQTNTFFLFKEISKLCIFYGRTRVHVLEKYAA